MNGKREEANYKCLNAFRSEQRVSSCWMELGNLTCVRLSSINQQYSSQLMPYATQYILNQNKLPDDLFNGVCKFTHFDGGSDGVSFDIIKT